MALINTLRTSPGAQVSQIAKPQTARALRDDILVSRWIYNFGSGTTSYDQKRANNLTFTNIDSAADWRAYGPRPGLTSFRFDGTDAYATASASMGTSDDPAFTASTWIRLLSEPSDYDPVFVKISGSGWSDGWGLFFKQNPSTLNRELKFFVNHYSSGVIAADIGGIPVGEWFHVAAVSSGGGTRIYVNGKRAASGRHLIDSGADASAMTLGGTPHGSYYAHCEMSDTRFYSAAMSDGDLSRLMPDFANFKPSIVAADFGPGDLDVASIDYDGAADYSDIPIVAANDFDYDTDFSFSFWVKTSSSSYSRLIGSGHYAGGSNHWGWALDLNTSGQMSFGGFRSTAGSGDEMRATADTAGDEIDDGLYHHVVVSFSGSSGTAGAAAGISIHMDGSALPLTIIAASCGSSWKDVSNTTIKIARRSTASGGDRYLDGKIDQVSLWDKVLSASDRGALLTWDKRPADLSNHPSASNLVGWYRLGAGDTTTVIIDSASGSNDGTSGSLSDSSFVMTEAVSVQR